VEEFMVKSRLISIAFEEVEKKQVLNGPATYCDVAHKRQLSNPYEECEVKIIEVISRQPRKQVEKKYRKNVRTTERRKLFDGVRKHLATRHQ
jgi:hypothetical protein